MRFGLRSGLNSSQNRKGAYTRAEQTRVGPRSVAFVSTYVQSRNKKNEKIDPYFVELERKGEEGEPQMELTVVWWCEIGLQRRQRSQCHCALATVCDRGCGSRQRPTLVHVTHSLTCLSSSLDLLSFFFFLSGIEVFQLWVVMRWGKGVVWNGILQGMGFSVDSVRLEPLEGSSWV